MTVLRPLHHHRVAKEVSRERVILKNDLRVSQCQSRTHQGRFQDSACFASGGCTRGDKCMYLHEMEGGKLKPGLPKRRSEVRSKS